MARYQDGLKVATCIFEAAAWHKAIKVQCRGCSHAQVFHAHGLWERFRRKGWNDDFRQATRHFKCLRCGGGFVDVSTTSDAVTITLPMPDERDWKRALSRFRG